MPVTAKPVRRPRPLLEQFQVGTGARTGSPLEIDEAAGVIKRVKVLGRFSRNRHNFAGAENGTEYSRGCMESAIRGGDYAGRKIKCNHPVDRANPGKERPIEDTFGVLQNPRIESDENGDPAIWADLHCLQTHPMYPRVVEDVKKGLGVYGLSHNASASRERFDRGSKRLVIEELAEVRSVDLVDKPATNRNLWESERAMPKTTTLRAVIEGLELTPARKKWSRWLLEDDATAPMMDAPMEADEGSGEGADESDALWTGFQAAIQTVLDKYKAGDIDAAAAGKQIQKWVKGHQKLTQEPEPADEPVEESEEECGPDGRPKKKDGDAMESEEVKALRAEKKARTLCESLGYVPTSLQVEAVAGIRDPNRQRELAESYKPTETKKPTAWKAPRAAAPGAIKPPAKAGAAATNREAQESEVVPAATGMRVLLGD